MWNASPENAGYRYDYFYDNCATRMRDVLKTVLQDSISFDDRYILDKQDPQSIRSLTDLYLTHQPWGDLGIDICLGLPMDNVITPWDYMFLPDYIEWSFDHASIRHGAISVPLVKEKVVAYNPYPEEAQKGLPHPLLVFLLFALAVGGLCLYDLKRKKISAWLDIILFGTTGLIGVLLLLLWTATNHKAAAYNFNLLWAVPTHVVAVVALIRKWGCVKNYFLVISLLSVLLLLTWFILPQKLNIALIPIVAALGARAFVQFYLRKNQRQTTEVSR
jgi:hypothetical protein